MSLTKDGIDTVPIEVSADAGGYTKIKSSGHRFLLKLHARATSGERIVAMKLGAFKGVLYFEGDGGKWSRSFANRDVGSGTRRTVTLNVSPVVPSAKIAWQGPSPKQACEINLANRRARACASPPCSPRPGRSVPVPISSSTRSRRARTRPRPTHGRSRPRPDSATA
ncbi:MAG: hypothetical protein HPM95_07150 [Alphaproteobacteria bacterium]|nr:hypothetical protein [Alphaproteobacteria bacterium]